MAASSSVLKARQEEVSGFGRPGGKGLAVGLRGRCRMHHRPKIMDLVAIGLSGKLALRVIS
jgi:hypothetical protein